MCTRLCVPAPRAGPGVRRAVLWLSVSWDGCFILESFSLKFGEWQEEKNQLLPLYFATFAHAYGI